MRPVLAPWLRAQSINVTRHAAALRPFRREEFGATAAAPSDGHIQAVNTLLQSLRHRLLSMSTKVSEAAEQPRSTRRPLSCNVSLSAKRTPTLGSRRLSESGTSILNYSASVNRYTGNGCLAAIGLRSIAIKPRIRGYAHHDLCRLHRRSPTCVPALRRRLSAARFH